jgi:hypothetical protein
MKLSPVQVERLVRKVLDELKRQNIATFKAPEDKVLKRGMSLVQADLVRESDLEREVNRMLDDLERKNPGEFERYKMYPLLKKRLAKEKGVIL